MTGEEKVLPYEQALLYDEYDEELLREAVTTTYDADTRRMNELDGATWTRYSISIWSDIRKSPEEAALKHPAMFPTALAGRLIECFTNRGMVVLDPFVGIGSTLVAAKQLGRKGIGIELNQRTQKSRVRD